MSIASFLRRVDRSLGRPLAHFVLPFINSPYFTLVSGAADKFRIPSDPPNDQLTALCNKFRTDKGSLTNPSLPPPHNYAAFYDFLLRDRRLKIKNLLECGIGTTDPNLHSNMGNAGVPGASLRVWKNYFPKAKIYGIDINQSTIFQEERISTAVVDQTDRLQILSYLNIVAGKEFRFDLIIDDGMHSAKASTTFLGSSIGFLSDNGYFIVEDLNPGMHLALTATTRKLGLSSRLIRIRHSSVSKKRKKRRLVSSNLLIISKKSSLLNFAI